MQYNNNNNNDNNNNNIVNYIWLIIIFNDFILVSSYFCQACYLK